MAKVKLVTVPTHITDVGGRSDSFTGGFARANPAVERLKSLGYEAEVVQTRPAQHAFGGARITAGPVYAIQSNAPESVVSDARDYEFTPEGQRAKID
ncbi:MAG: hypothetical protein ACUZ8A_06530 [Candidatus Bathyanammoxibius sp.]